MNVSGASLITWRMEAVGPTIFALAKKTQNSSLTAEDAWAAWADGEFGSAELGALFAPFEGLEQHLKTTGCPGFVGGGCSSSASAAAYKTAVRNLVAASGQVSADAAHQRQWARWSSLVRFVAASIDGACLAAQWVPSAGAVRAMGSAASRKAAAKATLVPLKAAMVAAAKNMTSLLIGAAQGPGEMGMISTMNDVLLLASCDSCNANLFGESLLNMSAAAELQRWLGPAVADRLPAAWVDPSLFRHEHGGEPRLLMLSQRTSVAATEPLELNVIVLGASASNATLHYRSLGRGGWASAAMLCASAHCSYALSKLALHALDDVEYFITVGAVRLPISGTHNVVVEGQMDRSAWTLVKTDG